jgi:uncharacterized protein (TIGR02231 family)
MYSRLMAAVLVTTAFSPAFAADIEVGSRIDAVTVYPQGAEITRIADVKLDPGEHALIFNDLPGDLQPETVRIEGSASGDIEIGSVDTKLQMLSPAQMDEERRKLEREIEALQDERSALDQAISDAEYQKSLMQQLASSAVNTSLRDGETRILGAQELSALLELVANRLQAHSKTVLDARVRQRDIDRQIQDISTKMAALAPGDQARNQVTVHLTAPAASSGTVRIRYRIQNAGWSPVYDAKLASPSAGAKPSVELVRRASVAQATTESWTGVALTLSTARPVGATSAPELMPKELQAFDTGRNRNFADSVQAEAPAPEAEEAAEDLSVGGAQVMNELQKGKVAQRQAEVQVAGFQALYSVPGRVSIDNTGTAKRVRIGTDVMAAKLSARTVPKLDPGAYLTAAFTLQGEAPLLPGPVMLYRDGVFMGQGSLPMLSPGQETELGFGVDDLIQVKRVEIRRSTGEEGLITSSQTDSRVYDISIKNLHDSSIPVTVLDQMPFTALQNVTIETLPGMTPPTTRDFEKRRGVLAWSFDLEPKAEKVLKHGYKISWPQEMQLGMDYD